MNVVVDLTRCQGYAQCAYLAPDAFQMRGAEALWYNPEPGEALRERVLAAAAACPVQAIRVTEAGAARAAPPTHARAQAVDRIVIVGASLAGLRAAAVLRREGFTGSLTVIGDEPDRPYDRPPLSKQVLDGWIDATHAGLPDAAGLDARWLLGVAATGLDLAGKRVRLDDGGAVDFDRLLIATGTRARPWHEAAEAALDGVYLLRTQRDAASLRRRLAARPERVLVIGGGFTGCEIASVCRGQELPVTLVERGPAPLVGALGGAVGGFAADLHRAHGVDLRCGLTVTTLEGDAHGRLRGARLSDGSSVEADVAVVALGAVRNTEWLNGCGLAAGPWGVACDGGCRAYDFNGLVVDDVFVAGDVARFPHPLYDYQFVALEHWGNAVAQAEVAAHNMVSAAADRWPHLPSPVFWSNQFGVNIKSVGVPSFADQVVITQGAKDRRRFVAVYGRAGRVTAAVTVDQGRWLDFYRGLVESAAPFPPDLHGVDRPADARPVPAQIPDAGTRDREATVILTGHAPSERRATLVHYG